jgi:hypothetical protein
MAETANSEFWRDLKPIEQKFRPGALPEAYIADAATDDDRYYAPLSETVGTIFAQSASPRALDGRRGLPTPLSQWQELKEALPGPGFP